MGMNEIRDRKSREDPLTRIARVFLNFDVDPTENIRKLTELCGELLQADSAMYDQMDGVNLVRLAGWNLPEDGTLVGFAQGQVRYGMIEMEEDDVFQIRHVDARFKKKMKLEETPCHNVYFGRVVKHLEEPFGALCVLYQRDYCLLKEGREILGIVAAAIAIEDKRLRAETLIKLQQQKIIGAAKMSALGELAAGVGHEVNNPLVSLFMRIGQLEDLLMDPTSDAKSEEKLTILRSMENLTARISKIVKSLNTFAGDTEDESFQEITVQELIDQATELSSQRFRENAVELRIRIADPAQHITCRPTEISRVFFNLFQNAFDAILNLPERWIEVLIKLDGTQLEVQITDSGPGIAPEIRDRIFHPFFTTKDVGRGQGLGLSTSKGIVEKHKGVLRLDPRSPHTRFKFTLPLTQS